MVGVLPNCESDTENIDPPITVAFLIQSVETENVDPPVTVDPLMTVDGRFLVQYVAELQPLLERHGFFANVNLEI